MSKQDPGEPMGYPHNIKGIRHELRGVGWTIVLVAAVTLTVSLLVGKTGLKHGSVVYLIPVVIAATRWGLVSSVMAAILGVTASAFFFYEPLYSFYVTDPHEALNLALFIFVAIVTSHLARQLKRQLELSRQREIDLRDLYAFSRRLAVAFDVHEIHSAIEDHLTAVTERKVVLFATARDAASGSGRRSGISVPSAVRTEVAGIASGQRGADGSVIISVEFGEVWLVRAVSPKSLEFGVVAVNLGHEAREAVEELRVRVETVLADATATLERLGVAHAISEARMRAQTDQLREALIGSVSHELRTPLASIMGAATVLGSAPALAGEGKLRALVTDVRDEAERLNYDIQNLLDASRISSDGISPNMEWADPADIVHSALERCRRRLAGHRVHLDVPPDLPVIHVDPVLIQQALVQIVDNARKYSPCSSLISIAVRASDNAIAIKVSDQGTGLTKDEKTKMWDRFFRGERHLATTSGSGLGLWIANAFIVANGGTLTALSDGAGKGASIVIELPVATAAVTQMESDADE